MKYYPLRFQWHITNRCNFRCKHCYNDSYEQKDELTLDDLKNIFDQYLGLIDGYDYSVGSPRILLTGGEPFMREDLFDLLNYLSEKQKIKRFWISILTNGSLLTQNIIQVIKNNFHFVDNFQISIEGTEKINDAIRGKGSFQKIIHSIELLQKNYINVHLSATLSKLNFNSVFDLLDFLIVYNIPVVIRRLIPIGRSKKNMKQIFSPEEMKEIYKKIETLNTSYHIHHSIPAYNEGDVSDIFRIDSCVNSISDLKSRVCALPKKRIIVLMPNGDVYPCRLYPLLLGNIHEQSLKQLYDSPKYNELTDLYKIDAYCKKCKKFKKCQGGAMCMSTAIYNNPFKKDPQCWK